MLRITAVFFCVFPPLSIFSGSALAATPTNVQYTNAAELSIEASWTLESPGQAPLYALSTVSNFSTTVSSSIGSVGQENVLISGLNPNTTYYFKVKVSTESNGTYSSVIAAATYAAPPVAGATVVLSSGDISISWSHGGNPADTAYSAELAADAGYQEILAELPFNPITGFTITELDSNVTFYFRVRAENRQGIPTAYTALEPVITHSSPPVAALPTDVFGERLTSHWITDESANTQYLAHLSTDSNFTGTGDQITPWRNFFQSNTFTGLTLNTQYFTRVKSRGLDHVESVYTSLGSTRTHNFLETPSPTNVADSSSTPTSLGYSWNLKNENEAPLLVLSEDYIFATQVASFTAGVSQSSHQFTGLSVNTTYYFKVKVSTANDFFYTPRLTTGTLAMPPLASVTTVLSSADINVSWTANGNPAGTLYVLNVYNDDAYQNFLGGSDFQTAENFTIPDLSPATTFYFQAQAFNHFEIPSPPVNLPEAMTLAAPPTPQQPERVLDTELRAHWNVGLNPPGTDYRAQLSTATTFTGSLDQDTGYAADITSFTFLGLIANTTYYTQVQARNPAGQSTAFVTLPSTVTLNFPSAPPPTGITFTAASSDTLSVGWTLENPGQAPLYALSTAFDFSSTVSSQTATPGQEAVLIPGLTPNTTYYFKVKVSTVNDAFYSAIQTTATYADAPASAATVVVSSSELQANWAHGANPADTQYSGEIATDEFFVDVVGESDFAEVTSLTVPSLMPNTTYYFRVRARSRYEILSASTSLPAAMTLVEPATAPFYANVLDTSLELHWETGSNPTGTEYFARLSTASNFTGTADSNSSWLASRSSFTFTGLSQDTTYYAQVMARNGVKVESAFTTALSTLTYPFEAILPPTNLRAPDISTGSLRVDWDLESPGQAPFYAFSANEDFSTTLSSEAGAVGQVTKAITGLVPNTTYYFKVKVSTANDYLYSPSFSTSTLAQVPVSSPTVVLSSANLVARWGVDQNPPGTEYSGEISGSADFNPVLNESPWNTETSIPIADLEPNTTYYLRIHARNWNDVQTATVALPTAVTFADRPGLEFPTMVLDTRLTANWDPGGNPSGTDFSVELASDPAFTLAFQASPYAANITSHTFYSLSLDTTYYTRVRARNHAGVPSPYRSLVSTKTLPFEAVLPPDNIRISSITTTELGYSWSMLSPAESPLYVFDDAPDYATVIASITGGVNQSSHVLTGLAVNTTYYFKVKVATAPDYFYTATYATSTHAEPPSPQPTVVLSSQDIQIAWGANGNPAGTEFMAEMALDPNFGTIVSASLWSTALQHIGPALSANTTHYARVRAKNRSNVHTTTITLETKCTFADSVGASQPPAPSVNGLVLNWTAGGNVFGTQYLGEIDDNPSFSTPDESGWLNALTTTFLSLAPNTTYYTRVRARNCDHIETANVQLATTATRAANPSPAPASGVTVSTITANWSLNGNPAGTEFSVDIAQDDVFFLNYASSPFAGTLSSTFTGLALNTTYYLRVRARNWGELETAPVVLSPRATDSEVPVTQPLGLVSNDQVTLNWSPGTNPSGTFFQVHQSTDSNFNGTLAVAPETTATTHAFSSLTGGTTYYFRVRSRSHNGSHSAWVVLPSTITQPSPPSTENPENVFGSRLRVHWGISTNAPGSEFFAELSTASTFTGSLDQNSGWRVDGSSHTFVGLTLGTTYYSRAKARNILREESTFTLLPSTATLPFLETLPPTSIGIDTVTANSLDAFWTLENPTMAAYYTLSELENFSTVLSSETLAAAVSSITLSGLSPNTTYHFKIKVSTANDLFFSDTYSTATVALDPGALTPVTRSSADITALWSRGGNPAGTEFFAERATDPGFSTGLDNSGWTTLNGSTFTALTPNTTYYLRVRSRGHNQTVNAPVVLTSTMTEAEPPANAASTILSSAGIFVSYSTGSNPGNTEFLIQISSDAGFSFLTATTGWGSVRGSTFTGLIPDTVYYSRAAGRNARGAETSFTTIPTTRTHSEPPTAAQPGPVLGHSLTLNWTGGGNPASTAYFAQLSTAANFTGALDQYSNWSTSLSREFTGLDLDTTYYSRVKSKNGDSVETPYVSLPSTMTLSFEATLPPTGVAYSTASAVSVDVGWTLRVPFQTPFYALSTVADFATTVSSQAGIPGQANVSIAGLSPNTTYYFKVKVSTAQDQFYSTPITTATEAVSPVSPSAVGLSSSDIRLEWTAGANPAATQFLAEAATNPGFSTGLTSGSWTTGFSSTFTSLSVNTTFYLRARARNHYGHESANTTTLVSVSKAEQPLAGAASSVSSATFAANWAAAGNPAGTEFLVERATDTGFNGTLADAGWTTALASTFTALTPNTTHYLRVRARSHDGTETDNVSLTPVLTRAQPPAAAPFTNVFDTRLTANWFLGANPAGTEFFTELSTAADFTGTGNQNTGWLADRSSNTFGGLSLGATYYLRVKARSADFFETAFAALGSTSTLPFPATLPPTDVQFTTATTSVLETGWTLENGSQAPLYALSTVENFATTVSSLTGSVGQSSATFSALSLNTTYWFKIKVSTAIDLFYSSPISTATLAAAPASSPSVVVSSKALEAHWLDGGNPAGTEFLAEAALDAVFSSGLSSNAWSSDLLSNFPSLDINTTYYLRVRARNWTGVETATVSLPAAVTDASLPGAATAVILSSNDARGNWTVGANPAGTEFQISASTDPAFIPASTSAWTTTTSSTFTGLAVNTTYYWRVAARSHGGASTAFVALGTASTHADLPVAGSPAAVSSTAVRADWTRGNNPAGTQFLPELAADAAFTLDTATGAWTTAIDSIFAALTPNTTYYTRVRGRSHGGLETSTVALDAVASQAAVPNSLAPVILSTGDFAFSWTPNNNPGGTEFRAQIGTDPEVSAGVQTSGWITGTTATFTALSPNTTYYARVHARNHAGVLTSTDSVQTAVPRAKPPVSAEPVVLSSADISAQWDVDGNPAATQFFAQAARDSGFSTGLADNGWTTGAASTFTALSPNTSYYFRVKARSHAETETGYTNLPTTMTYAEPLTANPPTRVFATRLTAQWGTATNPAGTEFAAEISTATDFTGSSDQNSGWTTVSSHTFIGLLLNTTYYSRVRPRNLRGAPSAYTLLPSTTTLPSETLPPEGVVFDTAAATTLDAAWVLDNATQAPFYALAVSSDFASPAASALGAVAQSSASIGSLTPNTTYWFRIKVSTAPDLFYSIPIATVTLAADPAAGASGAVSDGSILAVWNGLSNPAGTEYLAQRALDSGFSAGPTDSGWTTNTSFLFSPLTPNTTQYIRVRARNHQRIETSTISLGTVVTLAQLPSSPASVAVSSSDLFVSWSTGTNPTGTHFFVELSTDNGFATLADSAGWTDFQSAAFTGRTPNTLHYARVKTRNALGTETAFVAIPSTRTHAEPPTAGPLSNVLGQSLIANWGVAANPSGTEFLASVSTAADYSGSADLSSGWITAGTYEFFGLQLDTTYYARVKARNADQQETPFATLGSTITLATESALPPNNIRFTTASPVSLDIAWNLLSPAESPLYALSVFPNFITTASSQTGTAGQEFLSVAGLSVNTTYYFKVKVSTAQDQFYSSVIATATQARTPVSPTGVSVSSTDLRLDWSGNGNPSSTEFLAEAARDSGFSIGLASGPWTPGTSSAFSLLEVNTTYYMRVRARNHYGTATEVASASFTVTYAETPGAQSALNLSASSVTARWSAGSNPAGTEFRAEASTDASFGGAFSQAGWSTALSSTYTALTPNTTYYLRVTGRNHAGTQTPVTSLSSVHTLAQEPVALQPDRKFATRLTNRWSTALNPPGTEFFVALSTALDFTGGADQNSNWVANSSHTFIGLLVDSTYYSRVKARNGLGVETPYTNLPTTTTLLSETLPPEGIYFATATASTLDAAWILDNPSQTPFYALSVSSSFTTTVSSTIGSVAQSSASLGGLSPNTTYWFTIKVSTGRDLFYSVPIGTPTLANVPVSSPAVSLSPTQIAAQWLSGGNPAGTEFLPEAALDAGFTLGVASGTWTPALVSTFPALTANSTYYLRVRARNWNGIQTSTVALPETATYAAIPSTFVTNALSTGSLAAFWTANSNPAGTEFLVETATDAAFATIASSSAWGPVFSATFTSLSPNTTHFVRVRARNLQFLETANAEFLPHATLARDPVSGEPVTLSSADLRAVWDADGNPASTEFFSQLSLDAAFTTGLASAGWTSGTTSTFTSLAPNTTYYLRVKARSHGIVETGFTTLPATMTFAQAPGSLEPDRVFATRLTQRWETLNNPGGTEFYAQLSTATDFSGTLIPSGWTTNSSHTFTGLSNGTTYYSRVQARNARGVQSGFTTLPSTVTITAEALPPSGIAFDTATPTSLDASWTLDNGTQSPFYVLGISSTFATPVSSATGAAGQSSASVSGLTPNTTYWLRVKVSTASDIFYSVPLATMTLASPPAAGTPLVLSSISLRAAWTANSNPAGTEFVPEGALDAAFTLGVASGGWTTGSTGDLTGLSSNATYYLRVKARNGYHIESATTALTATATDAAPPGSSPPSQQSSTTVRVNWTANGNASPTAYAAEISTSADFSPLAASSTTLETFADFAGLDTSRLYYARVRGLGHNGTASANASLANAVTRATAPTGGSILAVLGQSVTMDWNVNGNFSGTEFAVEHSTDALFNGTVIQSQWVTESSHTVSALQAVTTYYFRVKARNPEQVESSYLVLPSTVTLTPPVMPTGVSFTGVSDTTLSLAWTHGTTGITPFYALATREDFAATVSSQIGTVNQESLTVNSLFANTTYYFKVKFSTESDDGYSFPIGTATLATTPSAPSQTAVTATSLSASWNAYTNGAGTVYVWELDDDPAFGSVDASSSTLAASATISGLNPNSRYFGRVRAINHQGILTSNSGLGAFATLTNAPTSAANPFITVTFTSVTVRWTPLPASPSTASAQGYVVEASTAADFTGTVSSTSLLSTTASLAVSGLAGGTTYYLRVGALNPDYVPTYLSIGSTLTLTAVSTGHVVMNGQPYSVTINPSDPEILSVTVEIPANSLPQGTTVTINTGVAFLLPPPRSNQMELTPLGGVGIEIDTGGVQPLFPVAIRLVYDPARLPAGKNPNSLIMARYDVPTAQWTLLPTTVKTADRSVTGMTDHFSLFAPFFGVAAAALDNVQIFPVPWEPGANSVFDAQVLTFSKLPEGAEVSIFSIHGERLKKMTAPPSGLVQWDGRNGSGTKVASGTYIALIKSGGAQTTRRVVVIR